MRLRRRCTGRTIAEPYRAEGGPMPAVLSQARPFLRPAMAEQFESWDERRILTDAELLGLITIVDDSNLGSLAMVTTADGGVVFGFDGCARAPRPSWWRRLLRWS